MPKNIPTYTIGRVLQAATATALDYLRDSHIIYAWKMRDSDLLPDFMFTDCRWRVWELECKNWHRYDKPLRIEKAFDKNFSTSLRLLLVGYPLNLTRKVAAWLKIFYTDTVTIGYQVTSDNYDGTIDLLCNKLQATLEAHGITKQDRLDN